MPNFRRGGFGLGLLLYQVFGVIGIDRIPPATLTIAGLQVALFLRLITTPWRNPSEICMSVYHVWQQRNWSRFFFAAFEHADDWHLYYNMVSFIWKGISLERRFGSAKFTYLVLIFTALCNAMLLLLCNFASEFWDYKYTNHCAVGFSGVIFALKVLTTHYLPSDRHYLVGLPFFIPSQHLVWAELLLIQLLVPNVSFVGHLAGIIVGLAYIQGPLKLITDFVWTIISSVLFSDPNPGRYRHAAPLSGSMYERYIRPDMTEDEQMEYAQYESVRQARLRNDHTPYGMREEEQFRWARDESLSQNNHNSIPSAPYLDEFDDLPYPSNPPFEHAPSPPYPDHPSTRRSNLYPDLDEMRRRRLDRFS